MLLSDAWWHYQLMGCGGRASRVGLRGTVGWAPHRRRCTTGTSGIRRKPAVDRLVVLISDRCGGCRWRVAGRRRGQAVGAGDLEAGVTHELGDEA